MLADAELDLTARHLLKIPPAPFRTRGERVPVGAEPSAVLDDQIEEAERAKQRDPTLPDGDGRPRHPEERA
jgi:hypothetical protein